MTNRDTKKVLTGLLLTCSLLFSSTAFSGERVDRFPVFSPELKFAYVDSQGVEKIPPQFFIAKTFKNGYATVAKSLTEWGLIDKKGDWVLQPEFVTLGEYSDGLIAAMKNSGEGAFDWGYINLKGEWVIKPQFRGAYEFENGYAEVSKKDRWGLIDKSGAEIIPCAYKSITPYHDGLVGVLKEYSEQWQFLDGAGKQQLKESYSWTRGFNEGLAAVRNKEDNWGFIDTSGKLVIPYQFRDANNFSEGIAAVRNDAGLYGAINTKGEWVIQPSYIESFRFENDRAYVEFTTHHALVDKTGAIIWHNKPTD